MAVISANPWSAVAVFGAAIPLIWAVAGKFEPPTWGKTALLVGAGQLILGAIPAYGLSASSATLPLFLLAWVSLFAGLPLATSAYRTLTLPLVAELGSIALELRFGVRVSISHADTITCGVTVGATHVVGHARRHAPYSAGSPAQVAVPLAAIQDVRVVLLSTPQPWLALADGTALHTTPGPAVAVRTPMGEFVIPTDDASVLAEIVRRRTRITPEP